MFIVCLEHVFLDETLYLKDKEKHLYTLEKDHALRLTELQAIEYIKEHRKIEMFYDLSSVYMVSLDDNK